MARICSRCCRDAAAPTRMVGHVRNPEGSRDIVEVTCPLVTAFDADNSLAQSTMTYSITFAGRNVSAVVAVCTPSPIL